MQDLIELIEKLSSKYNFEEEDKEACRNLIFKLENGDPELTIIDENVEYKDPDEALEEEDD